MSSTSRSIANQLQAENADKAQAAQKVQVEFESAEEIWAFKRARQKSDIDAVREGRATNAQMSWFSDGWAKAAKLPDSPF